MNEFPSWFHRVIDDADWYEFCDPYLLCVMPRKNEVNDIEYYVEIWEHPADYHIDARSKCVYQAYDYITIDDAISAALTWDGIPSQVDWRA